LEPRYQVSVVRAGPVLPALARLAFLIYAKYVNVNNAYAKLLVDNSMTRGRPELYPVKKVIGFDRSMLDAIDHWRRQQTPIPTVSDAIRALVELGLVAEPGAAPAHLATPAAPARTGARKKTRPRPRSDS
jgi:hypothetical protein